MHIMAAHPHTSAFPLTERQSRELEILFEQCFFDSYNTLLCGGGDEPVYLPSEQGRDPHRLIYREDFFASALHEIAHWCIAGRQRRTQIDFSYWYTPDGRDTEQQRAFEQVETKPQALEWIFSEAAGLRFQVSVDNLNAESGSDMGVNRGEETLPPFKQAVWQQAVVYCETGLPIRAAIFVQALSQYYDTKNILDAARYTL